MNENRLLNLPNALTMLRLALVPVFGVLYFLLPERRWIALAVFVVASVTDVLDGYLARRLNQITWFGKLFDPAADKLMCVMMLFCLAWTRYVPWWTVAVLFLKESYMALGAFLMFKRSFVVKSDIFGKASTFTFVAAIALLYPWHNWEMGRAIGANLLYAALALSLAAALHYTWMAVRHPGEYKP